MLKPESDRATSRLRIQEARCTIFPNSNYVDVCLRDRGVDQSRILRSTYTPLILISQLPSQDRRIIQRRFLTIRRGSLPTGIRFPSLVYARPDGWQYTARRKDGNNSTMH